MVKPFQPSTVVSVSAQNNARDASTGHPNEMPVSILLGTCVSLADRVSVYQLIERGISVADVCRYASVVALLKDKQILLQVTGLSARSLSRRQRSDGHNLNRDQSARILRFAQALDKASRVFGSNVDAESWISTPAMGLSWAVPLQMLINPVGYELVDDFLTRIEYGVYQ
ncbi:antitoxin Xre/MbcA/ParS toxin-binding domain-containing protein [Pseudomonas syringae]|uniref:antitoxin Xre/MbcA/ParS toxin-binding domain-containing protein n=1 Tax=Pseudomonas syringae TaxID=317 RepID=UPI00068FF7A7|nr:antitoxin Xre/MbcA/ParS toxin-binding domain-containing protein [Pseudomonas syringae]